MGRYRVESIDGDYIIETNDKNKAKKISDEQSSLLQKDVLVMDQHDRDRIIYEAYHHKPGWLTGEPENPL